MLNDQSFVEDTKRTGTPEEPNNMPEPRFSKMPDSSQEKQEVIARCTNGTAADFEALLGEWPQAVFQAMLNTYLPSFASKEANKYTIQQAETCIEFVITVNRILEKAVTTMDLGDINDLFLGDDQ